MDDMVHVLAVGPIANLDPTYDKYFAERGFVLAIAAGYRDLLQTSEDRRCEVAVLQEALSQDELLEVAHFIRRRWPEAGIVIIRQEEWWLEDAIYDERVMPGAAAELMLSAVERLVA
jgi:hypothetical protein